MTPDSTKSGKARWTSLVALAVVPLLAVGALLGLTQRDDDTVSAAVVNPETATDVVTAQSQVDDLLASLGF